MLPPDATRSQMREYIKTRELDITTSGPGRTAACIRQDIFDQELKRQKKTVFDQELKRQKKTEAVSLSCASIELIEHFKRHGASLSKESEKLLSPVCVAGLIKDFKRISSWAKHEAVAGRFAQHIRKSLKEQRDKRDKDMKSIIDEDVKDNPGCLANFGCTLHEIDDLFCANMWWTIGDERRTLYIASRLVSVQIRDEKHTCVEKSIVLIQGQKFRISESETTDAMKKLVSKGDLVEFHQGDRHEFVTTLNFFRADSIIHEIYVEMSCTSELEQRFQPHAAGRQPTSEQLRAIERFCQYRLTMITGPGGAGKSDVCLRIIMNLGLRNGLSVTFVATTHAVRKLHVDIIDGVDVDFYDMGMVCAQTLATLLLQPPSPIPRVILVDEATMVSTMEFLALIRRVHEEGSRLVLCGDEAQLPPINPGAPFVDMHREMKRVSDPRLTTLTRVFRTNTASLSQFGNIYRKFKINDSNDPRWTMRETSPKCILPQYANVVFPFFCAHDDEIPERFKAACLRLKAEGVAEEDVQCVAPTNTWCNILHKVKREIFRDQKLEEDLVHGDPCMFSKNTMLYKNGDMAKVVGMNGNALVRVSFRPDDDAFDLLREMALRRNKDGAESEASDVDFAEEPIDQGDGWWLICVPRSDIIVGGCVTVHKAQGSQNEHTIVVATNKNKKMEKCDFMYTAVSRPKQTVSLVGPLAIFNGTARPDYNPDRETVLRRLFAKERPTYTPPQETEASCNDDFEDDATDCSTRVQAGKTQRRKIRKALRDEVWRRDCEKTDDGECLMTALCRCCGRRIEHAFFHCAHIKSVFHGGEDTMDNLAICCSRCNESMGTMDLTVFQQKFMR